MVEPFYHEEQMIECKNSYRNDVDEPNMLYIPLKLETMREFPFHGRRFTYPLYAFYISMDHDCLKNNPSSPSTNDVAGNGPEENNDSNANNTGFSLDQVKIFLQNLDFETSAKFKRSIASQTGLNESEIDFNDPQILKIAKTILDAAKNKSK